MFYSKEGKSALLKPALKPAKQFLYTKPIIFDSKVFTKYLY